MSWQKALVSAVASAVVGGCSSGDQTARFIEQVDQSPPERRPPDWEQTKTLMARRTPAVGEPAPDFTLRTRDDSATITRSQFQGDKPLVLIFGSFT